MLARASLRTTDAEARHTIPPSSPATDRGGRGYGNPRRHLDEASYVRGFGNQDGHQDTNGTGWPAVLRLISELAAGLATVEPDRIDDLIVQGLGRSGDVLQFDLAMLWRRDTAEPGPGSFHYWTRHPQASLPEPAQLASIPVIAAKLDGGEAAWFTRVEEVEDPVDREALLRHGLRSAAVVPLSLSGGTCAVRGGLVFASTAQHGAAAQPAWTPAVVDQLRLLSAVVGQALARRASLIALQRALDQVQDLRGQPTEQALQGYANVSVFEPTRLRDRMNAEKVYARREAGQRFGSGVIAGHSAAFRSVLEQARQVAGTDSTVLLLGETGTGKELIATQLHELSARRGRTMVRVNCAAIPATLIESELFGREKGAYTGALARQVGRFELADGSTIFLDEIGDLPADVQVKLLRVLEERQIERLGSPKAVRVDVRIIAATHRNLEKLIGDGSFREDLFYRLNVFPIQVPALRDRPDDIPFLVWRFVDEFSRAFGKHIDAVPEENMAALRRYPWPGNIRELRNIVERAMIAAKGPVLNIALPRPCSPGGGSTRLADVERNHVRSVLDSTGWRIRGSNGAADRLGLKPTTLETRMAKLGLARPKL